MDNVRFHKSEKINNVFLQKGHLLKFITLYSLFLNPINNMLSKWKNMVKRENCMNETQYLEVLKYR